MTPVEFRELYGRFLDVSPIKRKRLDVAYSDESDRQKLDVYYPDEGEEPFPTIVFFHGGGFVKGDKRRYQLKPALSGLTLGYAVISVGYRLAPENVWPAFVNDASTALGFIHRQAEELEVDAQRIALWGESAGATLALQLGLTPAVHVLPQGSGYDASDLFVRAVIDWYAPVDLAEEGSAGNTMLVDGEHTMHELAFGLSGDEALQAYDDANPLLHLRAGNLPALLIEHGLADDVVSPKQSEMLAAAMKERGCDVETVFLPSAGHGVADFEGEENLNVVFDFLERHMD